MRVDKLIINGRIYSLSRGERSIDVKNQRPLLPGRRLKAQFEFAPKSSYRLSLFQIGSPSFSFSFFFFKKK